MEENLDNSNMEEAEGKVEEEDEDEQVHAFSSQELCKAVLRSLEIHGTAHGLKGRPPEKEEKKEMSSILAGAESRVIKILSTYGLQVETTTGKTNWKPLNSPVTICQSKYEHNTTCRFLCVKCKQRKIFTIVAYGAFLISKVDTPHLQMKAMYFHSSNCENGLGPLVFQQYILRNFDFQEVFGDTYQKTVDEFQSLHVTKEAQPVGEHINFNRVQYNFDNCTYLVLDGNPQTKQKHPWLNFEQHQQCLIRLFFHMGCSLGLEHEVCCLPFDFKAVEAKKNACKGVFRWIDYPEQKNKGHLFFNEVSLLSGGHNMRQEDIPMPVHQPCHRDGETSDNLYSMNEKLKGKFKPGSFIVPLQDHRTIYIVSPDHTVTAEKGQYMYFSGDVPHGGITYSFNEENSNKWHPALHGHLDSTLHSREQGNVGYKEGSMSYFPVHHYFIQDDLTPIFDDLLTGTTKVVEVAIDRMRNPKNQPPEHKTVPKEYLEQTMIKLCDALTQLKVAIGETGMELDNKVEEALDQLATGSKTKKKRRT
jgi:hypothetical protein